jgi:hypothetical protein
VASQEKRVKRVEVRLMFEPNRLSSTYLAQAYELLLPVARRLLPARNNSSSSGPLRGRESNGAWIKGGAR